MERNTLKKYMKAIVWIDEMSVGVELIDEQHRQIVGVVNHLQEVIEKEESLEIIDSAINFMSDSATALFVTEEKYFIATDYPDYQVHKDKHEVFINKVAEFKEICADSKSKAFVLEVLGFLWEWLSQHIMIDDQKYTQHLNAHGIK